MTLADLFDLSFVGRSEQIALEFSGRHYSFGELDRRSNQMAQLLLARGLGAGDRLCVYLENRLELIDLFLGCVKTGVIFVPVNILYREREIAHIARDAEPVAIVAAGDVSAGVPVWEVSEMAAAAARCRTERPPIRLEGDGPAAIVYTSGTTGASKGAILTHNNFAANALNLLTCWQISAADRLLLCLPLFHVHGLANGLVCWLTAGCRLRLLERFDRHSAAATFLDFEPTLFYGVPTIYVRLLETPPEIARRIGRLMRLFVSGSAPLSAGVFEEFRALFGHTILERYGMTETLMNTSNPYIGERRPGTVGLPLPGVSVRILDAQGNPVRDGETGELWVRGPNVFAGYWRRDEATRAAFRDGYFRTGDLGERSPDGYYTLRGRASDLIISGGFNIYPREIEDFLEEQDEVAEAAVVGVPDPIRGELPVAYVVLRAPADPEALAERCRRHLASFKVPRAFVPIEKLPRNALGKIQKHLLPRPPLV
jgi:malonyl-CoA/methylmalonyl-CoA synthetase